MLNVYVFFSKDNESDPGEESDTAFHCAILPPPEGPGPVCFAWSHDRTFAKCKCLY